ncbi:MAG: S24/S26 family peptidase [Candidatus Izemoplasmatales bacterium]|nr:S24/S26 family peptidase [Candidatus Izemoplasmatales bacterium]
MSKLVVSNQDFFETIIEDLKKGDKVSFLVKGNSMKPFLLDGLTEVFLMKKDDYLVGDICLFKYRDNYILHRLIKQHKSHFIFRGDNSVFSETVHEEDIYAYVYQYQSDEEMVSTASPEYLKRVRKYLAKRRTYLFLRRLIRGNKR